MMVCMAKRMNKHKTVNLHWVIALFLTGLAILTSVYVIWLLDERPGTDDAYAYADTINITPEVNGRVTSFNIKDNQQVQKGDILFIIDPREHQEVLNKAEASLQQLEQQIILNQRSINAQKLGADALLANVKKARAAATQATNSYKRLLPLREKDFVSAEMFDHALTAKQSADAALSAAQLDAESASTGVNGIEAFEAHRAVLQADIAMAKLNLEHTIVRAPFNGRVIGLTTTVGQYAIAGQPMFTLADTQTWFVIANFRETDLKKMRSGDEAVIYLMGNSKINYPAIIESIGYGVTPTDGSILKSGLPVVARSINWVHVAQRFPVRLRVTSENTAAFRIGASAVALIKPQERPSEEYISGYYP